VLVPELSEINWKWVVCQCIKNLYYVEYYEYLRFSRTFEVFWVVMTPQMFIYNQKIVQRNNPEKSPQVCSMFWEMEHTNGLSDREMCTYLFYALYARNACHLEQYNSVNVEIIVIQNSRKRPCTSTHSQNYFFPLRSKNILCTLWDLQQREWGTENERECRVI
jgi:hypothetical protein